VTLNLNQTVNRLAWHNAARETTTDVTRDLLYYCVIKVLSPVLMNERNHVGWPEVVAHDVLRHVHNVKSRVYVVSGQVRGKTLLPLPVRAEHPDSLSNDSADDK